MIVNLFSTFDPSTNIWSINWLRTLIIIIIIPPYYWLIPSRLNIIWNKITIKINNELKTILGKNDIKGTLILISCFIFILINNFIGLFPYVFTSTRHLILTLRIALPLWLRFIIYGWIKNTIHIMSHLIPQGTPPMLMPFMVIIETIRNIIRPITLAIRLIANIVAGHLLITLTGNSRTISSILITLLLIGPQILLLILESAVAVIQSYVFTILTTLYSREVN